MEENFGIDEKIAIKNLVLKYVQYWKLFLLTSVIALASMYLYLRFEKNIYSVESKIKIVDEKGGGMNLPTDFQLLFNSKIKLENEIEVLKSKRLLEKVVNDLDLNIKYFHKGKFVIRELWNVPFLIKVVNYTNFQSLDFDIQMTNQGYKIITKDESINVKGKFATATINNQKIQLISNPNFKSLSKEKNFYVTIEDPSNATRTLADQIKVDLVGEDSDILAISLQDENRDKSIEVVNKIVEKFNDDGIIDRQLVSKSTVEFINNRFRQLRQELDSIENKKKEFKENNNLSFIEADAALDIEKKSKSETELFKAESQLALSHLLQEAIETKNSNNILPANLGLENEIINALVAEFNTLVIQRDKLNKTAGSQNPNIIGLDSKLRILKNNIKQSIATYTKQLKISLSLQEKDFANNTKLISKIPTDEKYLRGIERQQQIKENLYLLLLQKREESEIAYSVMSPSIKIIDFANGSSVPIAPIKNKFYLIALLIGLGLPFIALYLLFLFDNKIKNTNEIGFQNSIIPIIGEIPHFKDSTLFQNKDDRSIQAETFRILTSNVNFSLPIKDPETAQVVMVTSSIMGEGKTYIASNLALALASYDKKVLLIGADMRKPKLKETLNLVHNEKGLSSYLHSKESNWKNLILKSNPYADDLHILFTGAIPPNPSNLLSNGRFKTLMKEAKKEYDYIVIDSTPTIYVNDTFLIAKEADLTVYITRFNYTDNELLNYSRDLALNNKLNNMVYVLNDIENKTNFNYKYNYNYGYGYGYGQESTTVKRNWFKKWLS